MVSHVLYLQWSDVFVLEKTVNSKLNQKVVRIEIFFDFSGISVKQSDKSFGDRNYCLCYSSGSPRSSVDVGTTNRLGRSGL